jgi:cytochrome b pre-mRNA-processing protein 3
MMIDMGLFGFLRRNRHERTGFELYCAAVAAARAPAFYETLGVPDTLDGRFDMVGLHTFLLIRRLGRIPGKGPVLSQAVFDAMFHDMDVNLREMGVGDLSVGKKVRAMWEAFHGRAAAYEAALKADDGAALEAAVARNVWRAALPPEGSAAALAAHARIMDEHLAAQNDADLAAGRAAFPALGQSA